MGPIIVIGLMILIISVSIIVLAEVTLLWFTVFCKPLSEANRLRGILLQVQREISLGVTFLRQIASRSEEITSMTEEIKEVLTEMKDSVSSR